MVRLQARPEPIDIDLERTAVVVVDMQNSFVSKGGMFIETEAPLAPGQPVMVNVHHPERNDTLLLDAVVRRVQRRPSRGVGVEFVRMDRERRDEFMEFVRGGIVVDDEERVIDGDDPHLA